MYIEIGGDSKCSHGRIVVVAVDDGLEHILCGYNVTDVIHSEANSAIQCSMVTET